MLKLETVIALIKGLLAIVEFSICIFMPYMRLSVGDDLIHR